MGIEVQGFSINYENLMMWVNVIAAVVVAIAGIVGGLWAYTKYVLERGLLPPVQFELECKKVGIQNNYKILETIIHLKNLGNQPLIAGNIRCDFLYLKGEDDIEFMDNPKKASFGRLKFPNSILEDDIGKEPEIKSKKYTETRGFPVIAHTTFVLPNVDQQYGFTTFVPTKATYVLIWASFEYGRHPSILQWIIHFFSRRLGLVQFSLKNINKPHTVERVFEII